MGQMSLFETKNISDIEGQKLIDDLKIFQKMNHPNLLQFIGFSPVNFKNQKKPLFLTEKPENGSLEKVLQILRENENSIPEWDDTRKLINIFGIASGMSYLHSKGIVHCSLKPGNIYLDEILAPKIGDFGLSTRFLISKCIVSQSIAGFVLEDARYTSPEIFECNEYSKSSDVYAFSLVVYEILTNEIPFAEINSNNEIYNEVVVKKNRPHFKFELPKSYRDLIESCWAQNQDDRPTFDEIVASLKNDPGFVTDKVNIESYQKYIKFIEKHLDQIEMDNQNDEQPVFNNNEEKETQKCNEQIEDSENTTGNKDLNEEVKEESDLIDEHKNATENIELNEKVNSELALEQFGDQNENIQSSIDNKSIGNPTNESKSNEITENITTYDDSEDVKLSPRSLQATNKTNLPSSKENKRSISDLEDQVYDEETLKTTLESESQKAQPQEQQITPEEAIETVHEKSIEQFGDQNENLPFSTDDKLIGSPTDKSKSNEITENITTYDDSEDDKLSPQSLQASNKTNLPSPRENKRSISDLEDQFYDEETQKTKSYNETTSQNQTETYESAPNENGIIIIQSVEPSNKLESVIRTELAIEPVLEEAIEQFGDQKENLQFSTDNKSIGSPTNESKSNEINENITTYDDSEDDKLSPRSLQATNKTNLSSPKENKRSIPDLEDQIYDEETLKTKVESESQETQPQEQPITPEEAIETVHEKVIEQLGDQNENLLTSTGDKLIGSPDDKSKSNEITENITTYDDSEGVKLSPRSLRASHKTNLPSPRENKRSIPDLEDQIYDEETLKTKVESESQKAQESQESQPQEQPITQEEAIETVHEKSIERFGDQNENLQFSTDDKSIGSPTNESKSNEITENITTYDDSEDDKLSPRSLQATNKTNLPSPKENKRSIPDLEDQIYDEETLKTTLESELQKIREHQVDVISEHVDDFDDEITHKSPTLLVQQEEFLAKKYINENDTENIYKYFCLLIKKGKFDIPLEYAINLYKNKYFKQAFNYFTLLSNVNHPIALFFIGKMKLKGLGCEKNIDEAYKIIKHLSDNGIDEAVDFLEENF